MRDSTPSVYGVVSLSVVEHGNLMEYPEQG
jgi:hypothetical protein